MKCRTALLLCALAATASAAPLALVTNVDLQPLHAQVKRVAQALSALGVPLGEAESQQIEAAPSLPRAKAIEQIQSVLDRHCLFGVNINPEMRVKVAVGEANAELDEHGWRVFLVKVANESGTTAPLKASSPNAKKLHGSPAADVANRWLDLAMFDAQPLAATLSGLPLEYRIIQLYSRDAGQREGKFSFDVGQGTQDLGFRNEVDVLFTAHAAHDIKLRVQDDTGQPTTASFVVRDARGRIYPAQSKRFAPDFAFHPQVYRADGESLKLPDGEYSIELFRGPESIVQRSTHRIDKNTRELSFKAARWIDPAKFGWWSGDHHIHAAGCAHYEKPTEGVFAEDMIRHCKGEDLKIGANLTWGPCFDFQKQFFCGTIDKVSQYPYLLRYDIEVSGFGSHQSGHLVLLRLKEQIHPGGDSWKHWPTLGLNTLKWAKKQGAVTGPAHSGSGIQVPGTDLPNYTVPNGYSHIIDFKVNDVAVGENGSELKQPGETKMRATAKIAARLDEKPNTAARQRFAWTIEKARIDGTRTVPVELVVNGQAVARKEIVADGELRDISFDTAISRSSWVALRILPSSHSNPIWVTIDGKPVRERKNIEWCQKGVDQCWSQKQRFYKADEKQEAIAAYDHARKVYAQRLSEAQP